MAGIGFGSDPQYAAPAGKQPPPTPQPSQLQSGLQGLLQNILSGFGLFTPPAPKYATAPTAAKEGSSSGTSSQQLPPASGGTSSGGTSSTSSGTRSSSTGSAPAAPQSATVNAQIECPSIQKEDTERAGAPVEIPWPSWATRYRVLAFSPVYSGHDDDRKEGPTVKHKLNGAPVGINIPARGELEAGATPPPSLVIVPTWQCISGSVREGNLYAVLSVVFDGPSNIPQGSN